MTDEKSFWDALSPYMDFAEDVLGINAENLCPIIPLIESPVLVVGAGQGLLVEALRQRGFRTEGIDLSRQMVMRAERRRGIRLILARAEQLPFEDGGFKTTLIATGVLDFVNDGNRIAAILNEARRVTSSQGNLFVAFFGATTQAEELAGYVGILSEGSLDLRTLGRIFAGSGNPAGKIVARIRTDPTRSIPGLLFRWLQAFLSMPGKTLRRMWRGRVLMKKMRAGEIPALDALLDNLPERMFIRSSLQIRELLAGLNFAAQNILEFDNCKIARL